MMIATSTKIAVCFGLIMVLIELFPVFSVTLRFIHHTRILPPLCIHNPGEFGESEKAYEQASRWGYDPQPGLALLRLVQNHGDAAVASIRRALSIGNNHKFITF
jgi:hypothetical protein